GFCVHEVGQAGNDVFGHLVLAGQCFEGVAREHLRGSAAGADAGVFERDAQQEAVERRAVFQVQLFFAGLDFVERWLGDVDVTALDQVGHLAIKEGEQQGADVRAVHVGVGHDDDAV
ncbi:MAG: hypothetical protein AN485_24655, partial [Anabaena sp. MDT14b]